MLVDLTQFNNQFPLIVSVNPYPMICEGYKVFAADVIGCHTVEKGVKTPVEIQHLLIFVKEGSSRIEGRASCNDDLYMAVLFTDGTVTRLPPLWYQTDAKYTSVDMTFFAQLYCKDVFQAMIRRFGDKAISLGRF